MSKYYLLKMDHASVISQGLNYLASINRVCEGKFSSVSLEEMFENDHFIPLGVMDVSGESSPLERVGEVLEEIDSQASRLNYDGPQRMGMAFRPTREATDRPGWFINYGDLLISENQAMILTRGGLVDIDCDPVTLNHFVDWHFPGGEPEFYFDSRAQSIDGVILESKNLVEQYQLELPEDLDKMGRRMRVALIVDQAIEAFGVGRLEAASRQSLSRESLVDIESSMVTNAEAWLDRFPLHYREEAANFIAAKGKGAGKSHISRLGRQLNLTNYDHRHIDTFKAQGKPVSENFLEQRRFELLERIKECSGLNIRSVMNGLSGEIQRVDKVLHRGDEVSLSL